MWSVSSQGQVPAPEKTLEAALDCLRRGFFSIPILPGEKGPRLKDWPNLRLDEEGLRRAFGRDPLNLGLLLGKPSRNLVDADLDCPEAVFLASLFLPQTGWISGRKSKP